MHRSFRQVLAIIGVLGACVLGLAACGSSGDDDSDGNGSSSSSGSGSGTAIKVGLVAETSGFNDRSFNHLALTGLKRAESELGVEGRPVSSGSVADYVPNLTSLARQDYDLVIAVGFQMAEPVSTVAKSFPETKFALVDVSQSALAGKPANVVGLVFQQQQASFLAGYLSRLFLNESATKLGMIGGQSIPPVQSWMSGYKQGAEHANAETDVLSAFSQTFADQAPCKQLADNQLAEGARVIFQIAGGCGLGVFEAVRRNPGTWFVGVDADQSHLGDQVLTSALKKVDNAVFGVIEAAGKGKLKTGVDQDFDLANDGVGLGKISSKVPPSVVEKVNRAKQQIIDGELTLGQ
jgi:basic membrane protein A